MGHPFNPPLHSHGMSQELILRVVYILATLILDDHIVHACVIMHACVILQAQFAIVRGPARF